MPLQSCYKELRGIKYCFSASDALVHNAEQEIPPELAEHNVSVGGLWWGPGKVEEGRPPCRAVPLFPFLADGTSPVTCGPWQVAEVSASPRGTLRPCPPHPFQPRHAPAMDGWEGGGSSPHPPILGFLPAPDFSSGRKEGDAVLFCAAGCWHLLFCLLQSVPCLIRAVGSRYLTEDKALVRNLGSDFDQLGDLGQLT